MKFLPDRVYFGHTGKRAFEVVKDTPVIGQYIKDLEDATGYAPQFVDEPPRKRQKKITPKSIVMPTLVKRRRFYKPTMRKRRYKRRYGTKRYPRKYTRYTRRGRYQPATAMNLTETKRYNLPTTTVTAATGAQTIVNIAGPVLNQDPATDALQISTGSGKQIYAMGVMFWITIANLGAEARTSFLNVLKLDPTANGLQAALWYDSRINDQNDLGNLHFIDRYKAKPHVGSGYKLLTKRAATLEPETAGNSGRAQKSFKIWIPIRQKLIWQGGKWNMTHQIRIQSWKTDGTNDALLDQTRLTYSFCYYFKD